jgi:hypothetical protein
MVNAGIFEFWNVSPHLETALEIGIKWALAGESVHYFHWGKYIPYNECYSKCAGNNILPEDRLSLICGDFIRDRSNEFACDQFFCDMSSYLVSIANLRRFFYKGYPLGNLILCNLCDITKSSMPCLEKYIPLVRAMASTYILTYENTIKAIKKHKLQKILVFNGRYISSAAVRAAAEEHSIPVHYHERGGSLSKYLLSENPIHHLPAFQQILKNCWRDKPISDIEAINIGLDILADRIRRANSDVNRFKGNQISGYIEGLELDRSKLNVIFFSSTDDEYQWVPSPYEYPMGAWRDQRAALFDLFQLCEKLIDSMHLIVRIHPNNLNKSKAERMLWDWASIPTNCVVIPDHSAVCSYALIREADLVITFGSTIGIEAAGLGVMSVLMAPALYDYLPSIRIVDSPSELAAVIHDLNRKELSRDYRSLKNSCAQYFYCLHNFGIDYDFYSASGDNSGSFLGI